MGREQIFHCQMRAQTIGFRVNSPRATSFGQICFLTSKYILQLFYPSVDRDAREAGVKPPSEVDEKRKKNKGFAPGPDGSRRWVMEGNRIPIKDEEHFVFAEKHGHDMRYID